MSSSGSEASDSEDLEYEEAFSGGNLTYPMIGSKVRKGGYLMIKGFPCKVTSISVSKTGKHGHAKAHVFGNDIFTGTKKEDVFPSSHNVNIPVVNKLEVDCVSLEDGVINYMNEEGDICETEFPEEASFAPALQDAFDAEKDIAISILRSMEKELVVAWRETRE